MTPGPRWRVGLVTISDSFQAAVRDLVSELGGAVVEGRPHAGEPWPDADATLILAGGEESAGVDLLVDSKAGGSRFLIGAAADHRIAAAALQNGAARLLRAARGPRSAAPAGWSARRGEAEGRLEAERFAEGERQTSGFQTILGGSPALRQTLDQARRVAAHRDVTVLIGGETGTGKELLARAIHYASPRAGEPFVEVNCAAIPVNLLESELFGHERGAFTGAVAAKPGLFEMAHGGTLFLDEIATLPLELQPKLLRALESRTIRRVGGQQGRTVDVRVIAATHVDLAQAVRRGEFREDLYYRLNVVVLVLPPLRDREGDVELLAETFVERIARGYGLPVPELGSAAREALRRAPLARQHPGAAQRDGARPGAVAAGHRSRSRRSAPSAPDAGRLGPRRCPSRRRWTRWCEPPRRRCST